MALIRVLGMDPSLTHWGLARGLYDTESGEVIIDEMAVTVPKFPTGKQVRQNSKDLVRAVQLSEHAQQAAKDAQAVFVEVPHGSQSARAMASYGICVGILGALRAQGIHFIEVSATEVKLATVASKSGSKQEIIERAVTTYPTAPWPYTRKNGEQHINASQAEHMADAIGAIEAGVRTEQFKLILPFIRAAA